MRRMTQNKSGWIVHAPGNSPVAGYTVVEINLRNGKRRIGRANDWHWGEGGRSAIIPQDQPLAGFAARIAHFEAQGEFSAPAAMEGR